MVPLDSRLDSSQMSQDICQNVQIESVNWATQRERERERKEEKKEREGEWSREREEQMEMAMVDIGVARGHSRVYLNVIETWHWLMARFQLWCSREYFTIFSWRIYVYLRNNLESVVDFNPYLIFAIQYILSGIISDQTKPYFALFALQFPSFSLYFECSYTSIQGPKNHISVVSFFFDSERCCRILN